MPAPTSYRERSLETGYGVNTIDRLADLRDDAAAIERLRNEASARAAVFVRDTPVLRSDAQGPTPFFSIREALGLGAVRETALLGRDGVDAVFAIQLDDHAGLVTETADPGAFVQTRILRIDGHPHLDPVDLRTLATEGRLAPATLGILAQAKALMHWHARHRFCSACGAPSTLAAAGWRRECGACKAQHFPRTDPVVIMLATSGDECLLGRQARFPKGMYSALAGFLEPGETIEAAVRREILEEAGITTDEVTYLASQPWPFPASLMIGCLAKATSRDVRPDSAELEDARWFSRAEIRQMLARNHPQGFFGPHPVAIAHHLVRAWIEEA